ncbi:MAG: hypothetical protein AAFV71_07650 [Cyanobacteria bacterium J06633_8]
MDKLTLDAAGYPSYAQLTKYKGEPKNKLSHRLTNIPDKTQTYNGVALSGNTDGGIIYYL